MKLVLHSLAVVILIACTIIASGLLILASRHEHLLRVETGSKPQTYHPGDALIVRARQVRAVVPGLGRLLDLLRHPLGLAAMVYLPASVISFAELRHLRRAYTRLGYNARLEA